MTVEADNDIQSLEAAFEAAETESQATNEEAEQEEASTDNSTKEEPEETSSTSEEQAAEDAPEAEPLSEENPFKEEYEERIKGYQRAYTKKVQQRQSESEKQIQALREEYDQKLQMALSKFGSQPQPKEDSESKEDNNSIDKLFEGYDPKSVETFKKAVYAIAEQKVREATEPLKQENEKLKGYVSSQVSQTEQQQKIAAALEAVPELKDPTVQHELATWAEANPNEVRGLTIPQMYKQWAFDKQRELGKREAKKEFERKEKQQLESGGVSNTVEDEEISSFEDAWKAAEREIRLKEKTK